MALLNAWESDAARVGRHWVLAQVARCRGLVEAALGNVEQAMRALEVAVAEHEAVHDPFGRARALLALGVVRRRARRKRPAREAIEAAIEAFETLGAAGWAEKARAELGRIGGRTRSEGLTAAEQRVAALVAEGPDEPRGRGGAFSRGAHGGKPSLARLRQARRPLAHRARAQTSDVLTFPTPARRP